MCFMPLNKFQLSHWQAEAEVPMPMHAPSGTWLQRVAVNISHNDIEDFGGFGPDAGDVNARSEVGWHCYTQVTI